VQNTITIGQRYPKYGQQHPDLKIGGKVLLDTRNINQGKLDERKARPFKISWIG
jgi:hypothetical protein